MTPTEPAGSDAERNSGRNLEHDPDAWVNGRIAPYRYADLLDLFIGHADRVRRSLCLMVLDEEDFLFQPMVINDVPDPAPCPTGLLAGLAAQFDEDDYSVLVGYARPGGLQLTDEDLRWQAYVADAFGPRLRGCYLVVPHAVRAYADCPLAA